MAEERKYTVEELITLCERHKVQRIKVGPLEVDMSPVAFAPPNAIEAFTQQQIDSMPKTDNDFLSMSLEDGMMERLEVLPLKVDIPLDAKS